MTPASAQPPTELTASVRVLNASAVAMARSEARRLARALGWAEEATEELAICASELAQNIVDHGGGRGAVGMVAEVASGRIELATCDEGAGVDPARAATPSAPQRGQGLATLGRLMDAVFVSTAPRGATIVARKWGTPGRSAPRATVIYRPHPAERESGDVALVERSGDKVRLAVIDGLGHGPEARKAALRCAAALGACLDVDPAAALLRAGAALAGTRGAAAAVLDVKPAQRLVEASLVGNCRAVVIAGAERRSVAGQDGVLGHPSPGRARFDPRIERLRWDPGTVVAVFSDGISSRLSSDPELGLFSAQGTHSAFRLFERYAVSGDDATLLLASGASLGASTH